MTLDDIDKALEPFREKIQRLPEEEQEAVIRYVSDKLAIATTAYNQAKDCISRRIFSSPRSCTRKSSR